MKMVGRTEALRRLGLTYGGQDWLAEKHGGWAGAGQHLQHLSDVNVFFHHRWGQRRKQPRAGGIFNVELERCGYGFHRSGCADPR